MLPELNGSIPPQLLGNAHFQVVLQNPSQGFARLAERIPVYQAWAITDKTDDSKLAKWALKHLGIINKQLSEVTFPKSANDQEKAILFNIFQFCRIFYQNLPNLSKFLRLSICKANNSEQHTLKHAYSIRILHHSIVGKYPK